MGGGTQPWDADRITAVGLSPRGWGNLRYVEAQHVHVRSIPAWAGEPLVREDVYEASTVYPRVGGGTRRLLFVRSFSSGLSPRGRGNPPDMVMNLILIRSIPAWAGEPSRQERTGVSVGVYPRVGGGTCNVGCPQIIDCGLSPRGRGNRILSQGSDGLNRSIPAWAGEPFTLAVPAMPTGVYPRVGGGTAHLRQRRDAADGLSPRGRGNPKWWNVFVGLIRVYPRVGGGTEQNIHDVQNGRGLSPRGRGNHWPTAWTEWINRSIPAWAGEPASQVGDAVEDAVYPRVGGGT